METPPAPQENKEIKRWYAGFKIGRRDTVDPVNPQELVNIVRNLKRIYF